MRFNYKYQVWYSDKSWQVDDCAHPDHMRPDGIACCNQYALAGRHVEDVEDGVFDHLCPIPPTEGRKP